MLLQGLRRGGEYRWCGLTRCDAGRGWICASDDVITGGVVIMVGVVIVLRVVVVVG